VDVASSMNGEEEEHVYVTGRKDRGKDTTEETKT
jgi:hypothetical protein